MVNQTINKDNNLKIICRMSHCILRKAAYNAELCYIIPNI